MSTYSLARGRATSHSARAVALSMNASGTFARVQGLRTRTLGSIPATQAYYWHHLWQAGEQETLQSLAQGNGRQFAGSKEAIAWLLADDGPGE